MQLFAQENDSLNNGLFSDLAAAGLDANNEPCLLDTSIAMRDTRRPNPKHCANYGLCILSFGSMFIDRFAGQRQQLNL